MVSGVDFPATNAVLNASAGALLIVGYLAVRRRHLRLHVTCMLSAFIVSLLFLTSYLYYHLAIRHGQPTHFTAYGLVRPFYFAILTTHTILATVAAPLAAITVFLGLSGRLGKHVRVARWTLPIWLYVSITGVVVYWMLYRLYPPAADVVQSRVGP